MSNSKKSRILIIGEVEKGRRIAESPLLPETGTLTRELCVEWLVFYHDNMGIITEQYKERLITGYPVPAFDGEDNPFGDTVSRDLFREFFERFLFAKKTRIIVATTPIAIDIIRTIIKKKDIRLVLYQSDETQFADITIKDPDELSVFCSDSTALNKKQDVTIRKVDSFKTLISILMEER